MSRLYCILLLITGLLFITLPSCRQSKGDPIVTRDTTITEVTALTKLVLDSAMVETFIISENLNKEDAQRFRNFYLGRNFQFTWFDEEGLTQQARSFWNLYTFYITYHPDSSLADNYLTRQMQQNLEDSLHYLNNNDRINTELKLTDHFFKYAQFAYAGKIDPAELQWHIPRKKLDVVALLDSLVKNKGNNLQQWEPVNDQYLKMQSELTRYSDLANAGGWDTLPVQKNYNLQKDTSLTRMLWVRLQKDGLINVADTFAGYDSTLRNAITRARLRFSLNPKGNVDATLVEELNVPVHDRVRQILVNMERMRWMPRPPGDTIIVANIPEFKLRVFEGMNIPLEMNIVVGKEGTKSVIFTNMLKYIVFAPYWNVPYSISKNEILPAMKRNSNYLARNNMEITGYNGSVPIVRQKPGGNNSLGKVKFLFPNTYNIYFHDTPSKSLFEREKRAFSHGCIRLQKPFELAKYLLSDNSQWTEDSISVAMNKTRETWVTLPKAIPVFITYLTAYIDREGEIHFTGDVYGHDKKLAEKLFH